MSASEPKTKFEFMKYRGVAFLLSALLVIFCIYIWVASDNSKFGIDFLGGTELVLSFEEPSKISEIRDGLRAKGFKDAIVQSFEDDSNEFSIRVKGSASDTVSKELKAHFKEQNKNFTMLRDDFVGPVIGEKIKSDGIKALVFAIIIILFYISWRFELSYALGSILALTHDIIVTSGIFIFLGGEIGASALAAFLTILGYSVNDTIIVFDRIRENSLLSLRSKANATIGEVNLKKVPFDQLINISINQTLSRTIITSGTTFFTCAALWYFGGGAISDLALILMIGILVGTYSSVFVASPSILLFDKNRADK